MNLHSKVKAPINSVTLVQTEITILQLLSGANRKHKLISLDNPVMGRGSFHLKYLLTRLQLY